MYFVCHHRTLHNNRTAYGHDRVKHEAIEHNWYFFVFVFCFLILITNHTPFAETATRVSVHSINLEIERWLIGVGALVVC